jgi:hypothetical protein
MSEILEGTAIALIVSLLSCLSQSMSENCGALPEVHRFIALEAYIAR